MSRFRLGSFLRIALLVLAVALATGCHGPAHVEFTAGQCMIDGRAATRSEVETRQARISERILARQPLFVLITVLIVALAGFSHVEKLILLFSTRKTHAHGLAERLRLGLERYRAHPLRYFSIVVGTLTLLGLAAGLYVYLDADKRASERALGLLQFCHVALHNSESQTILDEQRRNLQTIESTAGNIQALVDKLPPAEQRKARQIVAQINAVLAQQGKLVSDYAERSDESAKAVRAETANLEKGLATLGGELSALKSLPASVQGLSEQLRATDGHIADHFTATDAKLAEIKAKLDALAARPESKVTPAAPAVRAPMKDAPATGKDPTPPEVAKDEK